MSQQAKQANQKPSDWIRHRLLTKPEPVVQLIFPADTGELMATLKQLADLAWQLSTIMASRPDLYSREQREGLLLQLLVSTGDFKRVTEDVITVARQAIDTARSQL